MDYFLADKLVILHVFTLYCHSLVQLSLPLWSVCSVFNETTHLDFKKPRRRLAGLDTTHVVITFPLEADRFVSIH